MKDPESVPSSVLPVHRQPLAQWDPSPQPQRACLDGGGWACAPRDQPAGRRGITVGSGRPRGSGVAAGGVECWLQTDVAINLFLARLWLSFPPAPRGPGSSPGRVGCGGGGAHPPGGSIVQSTPPALALACPPPQPVALPPRNPGGWERYRERGGGGVTPLHGLSLGTVLGGCHVPPLRGCQRGQAQLPGG